MLPSDARHRSEQDDLDNYGSRAAQLLGHDDEVEEHHIYGAFLPVLWWENFIVAEVCLLDLD